MSSILKVKDYISVMRGQFVPIEFTHISVLEREKFGGTDSMHIKRARRLKDDEIFVCDIDRPLVKLTWISEDGFRMNRIIYIEHFYTDFINVELSAWTYSDCYTITSGIDEMIEINDLNDDFIEGMLERARLDFYSSGYFTLKSS